MMSVTLLRSAGDCAPGKHGDDQIKIAKGNLCLRRHDGSVAEEGAASVEQQHVRLFCVRDAALMDNRAQM